MLKRIEESLTLSISCISEHEMVKSLLTILTETHQAVKMRNDV